VSAGTEIILAAWLGSTGMNLFFVISVLRRIARALEAQQ
jgi:hypothetical protein